jgi:type VI secretion system protein VasJ
VRLEPDFVALQAEIDKLNSMAGAAGGVNWPLAETLAAKIVKGASKDILAAVYLAVAAGESGGPAAVAGGAGFLADFVETWWQTLLPPLKRMRARANAIEWWRDRTVQLIGRYAGPPIAQSALDAVTGAVDRLDKVLGEASDGLPSVREVIKNLAAIPVEAEKPLPSAPAEAAQTSPVPASALPPSAGPTATDPAVATAAGSAAPTAPSLAAAPPAPATPASGPPPPPPPAAKAGEGPESPGAAVALKAVVTSADAYLSYCPRSFEMPRYWDLSRLRIWLSLQSLPPAENGRTMLRPPPPEILSGIRSQLDGGAFREALFAAEDQRAAYVFWLDLDWAAAKALEALGLAACAATLQARVLGLVAVLPGVAELAFEDGTAFATQDTKEWLASAGPSGAGAGPSETALFDRYLEGDAARSLSDLGEAAARPRTGRERLLARAAEMRLYLRTGRTLEASALARWAVSECDRLELCSYDPAVAAKAMAAAALVLKGAGPEFRGDYLKVLGNLAQCGPRAVSELPPAEIV